MKWSKSQAQQPVRLEEKNLKREKTPIHTNYKQKKTSLTPLSKKSPPKQLSPSPDFTSSITQGFMLYFPGF